MRISDWSSDVCSSDLNSVLRPRTGSDPGITLARKNLSGRRIYANNHILQSAKGKSGGRGHCRMPRRWIQRPGQRPRMETDRRLAKQKDRKCDVSGKCVSVSVELGGPRRMKKKNKNKTKNKNRRKH